MIFRPGNYSKLYQRLRVIQRRRARRPFRVLRHQFYHDLWAAAANNVGASFEDLVDGFYRVSRTHSQIYLHHEQAPLDTPNAFMLAGNKPLLYRLYTENGVLCPPHCIIDRGQLSEGGAFMTSASNPVVVKPARDSGGGEGVTMNVTTIEQLRKSVYLACAYSDQALIERQIPGRSHRLLFLGGVFIDAVRRDPPTVVGDGKLSIKELIRRENDQRRRGAPLSALSPLSIDQEMTLTLHRQNLNLRAIPDDGVEVQVKTVANENGRTCNHRVFEDVHPSTIDTARRLVNTLNIEFAGVDIICRSISEPIDEENGVISEVNTGPGLHHHYLTSDGARDVDVAERVLDYALKKQHENQYT